MAAPHASADPSFGHALRALLSSDRPTRLTLVASLVLAVFLLLPGIPFEFKTRVISWFPLPYLAWIVAVFLRRRGEIVEAGERRFWSYLTAGFSWLLAIAILYQLPAGGLPARMLSLGADLAFAAYYFFLVLATECEPDRPRSATASPSETPITWPAAGIFVFGFLVYFTLLPPFNLGFPRSASLQTVHLFLALDTYLVLRFSLLTRLSDSPRWRLLYGAWVLALGGTLIDDLLRLLENAHPGEPAVIILRQVFWLVTPCLAVIAIRLRHQPLPGRTAVHRAAPYENARLPAASSRTLVLALGFPAVHLSFHQLGLLDPAQKPLRTLVALGWMSVLGLVALAQARLLGRRAGEIWDERKRFEAQLSSSEEDLRVILERRRAERSLKLAEDRFERIFRNCPDVVAITTEEDGRTVDVNPGFERVTGFRREEILGRPFGQILIWNHPQGREEIVRQLHEHGAAIEIEVDFRNHRGEVRIARLLLDRITIGGERCLITVARDVTERRRHEAERANQAALLDNASAAIYALDREERISFWNRGAERLFGHKAGETLGHPAEALETPPQGSTPPGIELWSTAILDDQGRPGGRLVIASETKPV